MENQLQPLSSRDFVRSENQLAEYELMYSESDLDDIMKTLSELEVQEMDELSALNDSSEERKPFFKDLIDAVVKGSIDYIDSITDITDTFDELKKSSKVKKHLDEEISKKRKPAAAGTELNWKNRTVNEAQRSPFDKNAKRSTEGMSSKGIERLKRYDKAYGQRNKFLSQTSKGDKINRDNFDTNSISLAGIESYRYGPVVEPTPISELKQMFDSEVAAGKREPINQSNFIRNHNYRKLEDKLMETFGFKTRKEAKQFYQENNLTPHEGPNGIFLIPSDVHDAVAHNGYATKAAHVLAGTMTEQEMERQLRTEKIRFLMFEGKERGTKIVNGVILSTLMQTIRQTAVFAIGVVGKEVYSVFSEQGDSFTDDVKRVMRNVWNKIKFKITHLWDEIKNGIMLGIVGNIANEILMAINDFIFKTAKNIFRIIRLMWKSLYKALKTIFGSESSWGERLFEAIKILAAGTVGVFGMTLNELIEKWLSSFGPLAPIAPILADIIAGFLGGILSAVMLMMFDKLRVCIFDNKHELTRVNQIEKVLYIQDLKVEGMMLATDRKATQALSGFSKMLMEIKQSRTRIKSATAQLKVLHPSSVPSSALIENEKLLNKYFQ